MMEKIDRDSHYYPLDGSVHLNTGKPNAVDAAAHEFGHQMGLDDRYSEPFLSNIGDTLVGMQRWGIKDHAGYEDNIMAHGNALASGQNVRDLARENAPTALSTDDQVRDWVSRSNAADMVVVATATKVRMVDSLMDGWISDQDVAALESICATARPGDQADAVRAAVESRIGSMWGSAQKARLQAAIDAMP
jgi:hypothetical protein